jgi:hypothetical protein
LSTPTLKLNNNNNVVVVNSFGSSSNNNNNNSSNSSNNAANTSHQSSQQQQQSSSSLMISNNNISGSGTSKSITSMEIDKIFSAIERFKSYTVYFSDVTLMKLMTSLVALSMNNLAVNATNISNNNNSSAMNSNNNDYNSIDNNNNNNNNNNSNNNNFISSQSSNTTTNNINNNINNNNNNARLNYMDINNTPQYLIDGIKNNSISFSLQCVIEITKLNAFRLSIVWQMVTSHLRMIASLKVF